MINPPPLMPELIERLARVMRDLNLSGMRNVQMLPGNPYHVEIRQFGPVSAWLSATAEGPGWWNRADNIAAADPDLLAQICAFFGRNHISWFADMTPDGLTEPVGHMLSQQGLYPVDVSSVLYGLPRSELSAPIDVMVREAGPEDVDVLSNLWVEGFEIPPGAERDTMVAIRRGWLTVPDNHSYVATVDGRPVAMAALYICDGIGFLNVGATLPAYRRRGCHTALTARRIADAARAGCDLVMGHTGFAGKSQNNEERAGLRLASLVISWSGPRMG